MNIEGIMLDTETLGVDPGCAILTIGACEFGPKGIGKKFYEKINLESCTNWGLKIEPRTTMWWMEQSEDARKALVIGKKADLDVVLSMFNAAFKWKGRQVWCNGASFDFPIMTAAYRALGWDAPWEFWGQMDFRTIKNLVPKDIYAKLKVDAKVKHDALEDAISQAQTLLNIADYIQFKELKNAA